jgi:hypothetical protein
MAISLERHSAQGPEMSDGVILDLAFELIREFELHEAAGRFQVDGTRVYFPHNVSGAPLFEVPAMHTACVAKSRAASRLTTCYGSSMCSRMRVGPKHLG